MSGNALVIMTEKQQVILHTTKISPFKLGSNVTNSGGGELDGRKGCMIWLPWNAKRVS